MCNERNWIESRRYSENGSELRKRRDYLDDKQN